MTADRRYLVVFRVLYGALGFVYAMRAIQYRDLLWFPLPEISPPNFWWPHLIWLALSVAIAAGVGGRWSAVLHFVVAKWIFDREMSGDCIEKVLFLIPAFWLIWLPAWDRDRERPIPGWPVFAMGLHLTLGFFGAGLAKALDPQWRSGNGLAHVLQLQWLRAPWVAGMLEWPRLLEVQTGAIIVGELAVLVLFLVPNTRRLAVALLATFFVALIAVLRLGNIGEIGLIICVGLAGLRAVASDTRSLLFGITLAVFVYFAEGNTWAVFTGNQIRGAQAYRVKFKLEDGSIVEGARVFEEDRSGAALSVGVMTTRWPQLPMYYFMGLRRRTKPEQFGDGMQARALGVIRFCAGYLSAPARAHVREAIVETIPVGTGSRLDDKWVELMKYDPRGSVFYMKTMGVGVPLSETLVPRTADRYCLVIPCRG